MRIWIVQIPKNKKILIISFHDYHDGFVQQVIQMPKELQVYSSSFHTHLITTLQNVKNIIKTILFNNELESILKYCLLYYVLKSLLLAAIITQYSVIILPLLSKSRGSFLK